MSDPKTQKIVIGIFLFLSGCATTGWNSKIGYSFIGARTESGGMAFNKGNIEKTGEACAYNILGLFSLGDSGIAEAKKRGGLEKIFFFDTKIVNVWVFYGSICTKVYGK